MRARRGIAALAVLATAGCGSSAAPAVVTVTSTVESTSSSTPTPQSSSPAPVDSPSESAMPTVEDSSAAEETFKMPKVVGMVLQDAQDLLQSMDSYVMDQQDALYDRLQIDDSNWRVCSQSPKPGAVVPVSTVVVLKSVKLREKCP